MTYHWLQHGGPVTRNPNQEMYPAAKITQAEPLRQAAHKEPIAFGNTRLFDFSQKDGRRQAGLQQYLDRAAANGTPLQQGDIVGACACPAQAILLGYAWAVENPEPGVTFKIKTHFGGQTLATVDGSVAGSDGKLLGSPVWLKDNELLDLEFTSFPANGVSDLRFWVTPILLVPKVGN